MVRTAQKLKNRTSKVAQKTLRAVPSPAQAEAPSSSRGSLGARSKHQNLTLTLAKSPVKKSKPKRKSSRQLSDKLPSKQAEAELAILPSQKQSKRIPESMSVPLVAEPKNKPKRTKTRRSARKRVAAVAVGTNQKTTKKASSSAVVEATIPKRAAAPKKAGTTRKKAVQKDSRSDSLPKQKAVKPTPKTASKVQPKQQKRSRAQTKVVQPQLALTTPVQPKGKAAKNLHRAAKTGPEAEAKNLPKATRKRAPSDLAAQYGEKAKKRPSKAAAALAKARAARRTAEERARLHQIMAPSNEVLRRLARIGAITSDAADEASPTKTRRSRSLNSTRRSRNWELSCGKCGTKGKFHASAGVCSRCGAIAVRV